MSILKIVFIFLLLVYKYKNQETNNIGDNNKNTSNLIESDENLSNNNNLLDKCSSYLNPKSLLDCKANSSEEYTCCININESSELNNNSNNYYCSKIKNNLVDLVDGSSISKDNKIYIQKCKENKEEIQETSTCGKENPINVSDCTSDNKSLFESKPYMCCYSKVTVSGSSKTGCIVEKKTANSMKYYNNGGLQYDCIWSKLTINNTIFLMILFVFWTDKIIL